MISNIILIIGFTGISILFSIIVFSVMTWVSWGAVGNNPLEDTSVIIKGIIGDYKLNRKLPAWKKFRKLQRKFGVYCLYENEETRKYLLNFINDSQIKPMIINNERYFDDVIEYLKVLNPKKNAEDRERFKVLKTDFQEFNDEIHENIRSVQKKNLLEVKSKFQKELPILKAIDVSIEQSELD